MTRFLSQSLDPHWIHSNIIGASINWISQLLSAALLAWFVLLPLSAPVRKSTLSSMPFLDISCHLSSFNDEFCFFRLFLDYSVLTPTNYASNYLQYFYESEILPSTVSLSGVIESQCSPSNPIFLSTSYVPFVGMGATSDPLLINPQTLNIKLSQLTAHYTIYF